MRSGRKEPNASAGLMPSGGTASLSWSTGNLGSVKPSDRHKAMPSPVAFRLMTRASVSSRNQASSASKQARA